VLLAKAQLSRVSDILTGLWKIRLALSVPGHRSLNACDDKDGPDSLSAVR
jgi:hypothetical protein